MKTLLAIVNKPQSKGFLNYVAGMATNLSAKVKVLYAHPPVNYPVGVADAPGQASIEMRRTTEQFVAEATSSLNKTTAEINERLLNSAFTDVIAQVGYADSLAQKMVENNEVHMVVMEGKKDEGFWSQSSSNMDVVEKVNCPVWIIPKEAVYQPFKQIVYATDFKKEDITNIKNLIRLFPVYMPNIVALHITDSVDFEERVKKAGFVEMLRKQIDYEQLWVKAVYQSKHDDLNFLINEYALKTNSDLIVVLKENKSFFKRIFNTSHTKEILKTTQFPVLVYHEK